MLYNSSKVDGSTSSPGQMLKTKASSPLISRHFTKSDAQQTLTNKLLSLLKQCDSTKSIRKIHAKMIINSVEKPSFLLHRLIDIKDFDYASSFFSHIPYPNEYAFNIMIRGLATTWKKFNLSIEYYYQMKDFGIRPNNFTYPFVFIACANLFLLNHGQCAHSGVLKSGLGGDGHVRHSLITMYSRCGELGCARRVFDEISEKDSVSWNSMISGYSRMGYAGDAVRLFGEMRLAGFEPDEMTLVSLLGACGDLGDLGLGSWVEGFVTENEMELNTFIGSALIAMYGKCGDLSSAKRVFDTMTKKDVITWNAMISGYAQNGMSNEAILLFGTMRKSGLNPDKITLVGVLSACASIGALDFGKWLDRYASERGLQNDIYVATALIDMYAKCGCLDDALRVFEDMPKKNEVSWNAMISALAFHGRPQESLSLFKRMSKEGGAARPNDISFIGVLSACVHAGLVDEGRQLFDSMSSSFGLVPKIEHFSCMVDLLARAGHVHEAWDFIEKMPGKPDEVMLGSLLGACQKLRNVDVGERVMQLLLEMEPLNSGNYVISSKIFANMKRLDDSARMRVLMRQRGVTKTPGCSWIEIENQVHEFHAGDILNFMSLDTCQVIKLLNEEMKVEGYVPNVNLP